MRQKGLRVAIGGVTGDQDDAGAEFRAVLLDPSMDFSAIYGAGHADIGDHAEIFSAIEFFQAFGAGRGVHDRIAAALESGASWVR